MVRFEVKTEERRCASTGCTKPGKMLCPKCVQYKIETYFCDQDCFKASWKDHIQVHKIAEAKLAFKPPSYPYTGSLRPHFVTPMRDVPAHIQKPEYALSGTPINEIKHKRSLKIHINSQQEIDAIRVSSKMGREILDIAGRMVRPGVTPEEIDAVVHEETIKRNAYPSPLNYNFFPKSCCTSINEAICHGIPDCRPLVDGDIINIDISLFYNGFHTDLNETFCVGNVDEESKQLIKTAYESLELAIKEVRPGVLVRDLGKVISQRAAVNGFSVVRSYCGHGVGALFHANPDVPHYAKNKAVGVLKPGMVLTIEPMINVGTWKDQTWPDNWTVVTCDGKRSAQFEHTLLVTETGVEVLTARTANSVPFWWEDKTLPSQIKEEKTKEKPKEKTKTSLSSESTSSKMESTSSTLSTSTTSPQSASTSSKKKKKKKKK